MVLPSEISKKELLFIVFLFDQIRFSMPNYLEFSSMRQKYQITQLQRMRINSIIKPIPIPITPFPLELPSSTYHRHEVLILFQTYCYIVCDYCKVLALRVIHIFQESRCNPISTTQRIAKIDRASNSRRKHSSNRGRMGGLVLLDSCKLSSEPISTPKCDRCSYDRKFIQQVNQVKQRGRIKRKKAKDRRYQFLIRISKLVY